MLTLVNSLMFNDEYSDMYLMAMELKEFAERQVHNFEITEALAQGSPETRRKSVDSK